MKAALLLILALLSTAPSPAPVPAKVAPCTFRTHREWPTLMVPRIERSFGILSMHSGGEPVLIRPPKIAVALPTIVTSTPCVNPAGDQVYVLTGAQVQALVKAQ